MKKVVLLLIVAAVAGASYYVLNRDEVSVVGNKTTNSAASGITAYKQVDACSVLQPADAEFAIGQGAKKSDSGGSNTASDDITVSSCLYYKTDVLVSGYKSASLLVRVAKTAVGSANNKSQFGSQKPANVQDVAELGEAAYWSPEYGQLNVLVADNWYIISSGVTKSSDRKQADAVALASKLLPRL